MCRGVRQDLAERERRGAKERGGRVDGRARGWAWCSRLQGAVGLPFRRGRRQSSRSLNLSTMVTIQMAKPNHLRKRKRYVLYICVWLLESFDTRLIHAVLSTFRGKRQESSFFGRLKSLFRIFYSEPVSCFSPLPSSLYLLLWISSFRIFSLFQFPYLFLFLKISSFWSLFSVLL